MTTLTPLKTKIAPLSSKIIACLRQREEPLQTAVADTLQTHIFHNSGYLGSTRAIPETSQKVVDVFLQALGAETQEALIEHVTALAEQGLGPQTALSLSDALYQTSLNLLQEEGIGDRATVEEAVGFYRRHFLYLFMETRYLKAMRDHEQIHQGLSQSLNEQVQQERALRDELEKERAQLRESEARLAEATDMAGLYYWEADLSTHEFEFTPEYYELLGATAEAEGGYRLPASEYTQKYVHPDDTALIDREVEKALAAEDPTYRRQFEMRNVTANGRVVPVRVRFRLVRDAEGAPVKLIGANQDITEQKKAEAESRRLGYVVEQSLDGTAIADLDGTIQFVNSAWAEMHGYQIEEIVGEDLSVFHTEKQFEAEVAPMNQAVKETGEAQRREVGHVRKDESIFPTEMTVTILRDEWGEPIGLTAWAHDITERKQAEREIRAAQEQAQSVLEAVTTPLLISRLDDGRILYANERLATLLKQPLDSLLGNQTPNFYTDTADRQEIVTTLQEKGEIRNYELKLQRENGELFWVFLSARIFEYGDEMTILTSMIDITARREVEAALAKQAEELQTVAEVSTTVSTTLDQQELLQNVVDLTQSRFDLYHAHVYLLDEAAEELVLTAGAGKVGQQMVAEGHAIPLDREKSLVARAARTHQGVIVNDVQADSGFLPNPLLPHTRAEMAVPMIVRDQVLGVLDVQADELNRFSDQDVQIQTTLAAQTAVALQNARQYEQTQQALQQARAAEQSIQRRAEIEKIGAAISANFLDLSAEEIDAGVDQALEMVGEFAGVDRAYLFLFSEDGATMSNTNEWCAPDVEPYIQDLQELPVAEFDFLMSSLGELETFYVPRVADLPDTAQVEREEFEREGIQSIICEPLISYGEAIGFIGFDAVQQEVEWRNEDIALLRLVADVFVSALRREEAGRELQQREELLSTIINSTPDWIFVKNREHRYQLVNQGYADSIGIEPEKFIGKDDLELGFPEDIVKGNPEKGIVGFWPDDNEVMESGEMKVIDVEPAVVDGERRYLNTIKSPLRDADGDVVGVVGFVHDITDRMVTQEMLSQRAQELQTVTEVGAAISTTLDTNELLQEVVDLAKERFNLYHAHIYLLNPAGDLLVLSAGAGEVGKRMVAEKRTIPLDQEQSLVAQAARMRKGVIVNDVRADEHFLPHALLPETRAEMAVPMIVGDGLLGVLDVQADETDRFTDQDLQIQSTLASQTAVALQNARYFEQSEQAMQELNALTRRLTREGWEGYETQRERELAFLYDAEQLQDVRPLAEIDAPLSGNGDHLIHPLTIHGEEIGQIALEPEENGSAEQDDEVIEIIAAVADQLSAHIENLRLTEETQLALAETEEQAARLARLNEMAAALNAAEEVENIFQIAAEQVLDVVGGTRASVALFEEKSHELKITAVSGVDTVAPVGARVPLDQEAGIETAVNEMRVVINQASTVKEQVGDGLKSTIIAPLVTGSRVLGTLNVGSESEDDFDQNDENLIRQVAAVLVSTVENRRLLEETRQRADQLGAINRVSQSLSQYLDREELLEAAHIQIREALEADAFFVGLYDAEQDTIDYPLIYERESRSDDWGRPLNPNSNSYHVITTGEPIMRHLDQAEMEELRTGDPLLIGDDHRNELPASLLYAPLRAGQRILGVLSAQSYHFDAYTENDLNLLSGIAGYLAIALENVRLFDETQQRAQQLQALSEIENELSQAETEEDIVTALAGGLVEDEESAVSLYYMQNDADGKPQILQPMATWEDGAIQRAAPILQQSLPFQQYPVSHLLLDSPFDVLYISDLATDERVDEATRAYGRQLGIRATATMPLRSGGRWQGVFVFTWPEPRSFSERERFLLESLLEPVSAVVASRRALLAQQEALDETAVLYEASAALNAARSYDEILDVLREHTILGDRAHNVSLNYFDRAWTPQQMPEWSMVLTRYSELEEGATMSRYRLAQFPAAERVLKPDEATRIEDVDTDPRLDENSRALYAQQFQGKSTIFVPLNIAGRWVGYVNAIYDWKRTFPEEEVHRLMALAGQATIAVSNRRLLDQTRTRADQLEKLAQVEVELSQAVTEEEILATIAQSAVQSDTLKTASLSYINLDENEQPQAVTLMATWAAGQIDTDSPLVGQPVPLEEYPPGQFWFSHPNEVTFIDDLQQTDRLDEQTLQRAEAAGLRSLALIPLRSGGRWQGVVTMFCSEPDGFDDMERFILPQLMDSMAAVVASRRAQLAQQAARHEAESLYEASQRINESPTTNDILAAVMERTDIDCLNRAAVMRFVEEKDGERRLEVTATWYSGEGQSPPSIGTRYPLQAFAAMGPVWESEPIFIADTEADLDGEACAFAQQMGMQSVILLPLFSGAKQVGLIVMLGEHSASFGHTTRRILSSLAPQVAIALENKRLLAETEARARREQLLRQITARVRGSADIDTIMRTAVQEIGRSLGRKAFIYVGDDEQQ